VGAILISSPPLRLTLLLTRMRTTELGWRIYIYALIQLCGDSVIPALGDHVLIIGAVDGDIGLPEGQQVVSGSLHIREDDVKIGSGVRRRVWMPVLPEST